MQKFKNNWKRIVVALIILVVIFFAYQKISSNTTTKKPITYTVKRQDITEQISLSGHIDAAEHAKLQFQTSGLISWIGVIEGDVVQKYQIIASLDQRSIQKQLQKYLNTYGKSRDDFDQVNKDTYRDLVISDPIKRALDKAQLDLNSSVLDVEIQDIARQFANLSTPIEGIITKIDSPVAGVNISTPTQATFEVVNPKTLYFSAVADQTDVVNLATNMTGNLSLDAFPNRKISGTITSIGFMPKEGESGTVYEIKVLLDEKGGYRFGMTGDISFVLKEKKNVLAVPKNLIKIDQGKKYIWTYLKNVPTKKEVITGDTLDNQTEILEGLSENETVGSQP